MNLNNKLCNVNQPSTSECENYDYLSSDDSDILVYDENDDVTNIKKLNNSFTTDKNNDNNDSIEMDCDSNGKSSYGVINLKCLQKIIDENINLKVLFKNHFAEPLTFLLLLHDYSLEVQYTKIIEDCGGIVYSDIKDMDGFTIVFVKDDSLLWSYSGPVFKLSYISACIESKKIIDISKFFKKSRNVNFTKNFNYMTVFYFKKFTWNSVPDQFKLVNKSYGKNSIEACLSPDKFDSDDYKNKKLKNKCKTINKHTRAPYSIKEDEDILKFIIKQQAFDHIKGTLFWRKMESKAICPYRTWQSMKEHFRKKIVYNLNSHKFLSDEQKKLLQNCTFG